MEVYIKSKKDFKTIAVYSIETWTIEIATATTGTTNRITIPDDRMDYTGDWIIIDGFVGLISAVSFGLDGTTSLTVADPATVFNTDRAIPNTSANTYGGFISCGIYEGFSGCEDLIFALPYISIANSDTTYYAGPDSEYTPTYNLYDVIVEARKNMVDVFFRVNGQKLIVVIRRASPESRNITPEDGVTKIKSINIDHNSITKITVMTDVYGDGSYYLPTTYYVTEGTQLSSTPSDDAYRGVWKFVTGTSDEQPYYTATEAVKDNISNHKIEFSSSRKLSLYDSVIIELPFGFMRTTITSISMSGNSEFYDYICGTLPVTLTEIIKSK